MREREREREREERGGGGGEESRRIAREASTRK